MSDHTKIDRKLLNLLPSPLQNIVDVISRIASVWVLHRKAGLFATGKEVLVFILIVFIRLMVSIIAMSVSLPALALKIFQGP